MQSLQVQTAPLPKKPRPIAPHQLWAQLTPSQQQHVRQALIAITQCVLSPLPAKPPAEESNDER